MKHFLKKLLLVALALPACPLLATTESTPNKIVIEENNAKATIKAEQKTPTQFSKRLAFSLLTGIGVGATFGFFNRLLVQKVDAASNNNDIKMLYAFMFLILSTPLEMELVEHINAQAREYNTPFDCTITQYTAYICNWITCLV